MMLTFCLCRKTYAWSDPDFISSGHSASFVPRSKSADEETVILPNVFDMRQPMPLSIKKTKIMKMWQVMLAADDDEEEQESEDQRLAKFQAFMMSFMPKEWYVDNLRKFHACLVDKSVKCTIW